jgi:hypothetical protein
MSTFPITEAWDLIGHEGKFRIQGGRTIYEAVIYNDSTARGRKVRLARLDARTGLHQINRWIAPETLIEVLVDYTAAYEAECEAEAARYA